MAKENARLLELLHAWSNHSITSAEEQELAEFLDNKQAEQSIHAYVEDLVNQYSSTELLPVVDWEKTFENILAKKRSLPVDISNNKLVNRWWRIAAAAAVVLAITTAIWIFNSRTSNQSEIVLAEKNSGDITAPENNQAMITLADGSTVSLESLKNGVLAQQGNVKLMKLADGRVAYETTSGKINQPLQYNTLVNPRGSKVIDITLSDGSHLWLNAGSSITYPVAFAGRERKVAITGEAYFEVAHDPSKPFFVMKDELTVNVLGTHFNVNAYDNEKDIRVTLLEGSVQLRQGTAAANSSVTLRPGQQGVVSVADQQSENSKGIIVNHVPDIDEVMAWKNGVFHFNRTILPVVLRQFERWYNVDVVYKGVVTEKTFSGEMGNDLSLTEALEGLRDLGVRFKIEGRKLIVEP
jgi:transmembrane sensor